MFEGFEGFDMFEGLECLKGLICLKGLECLKGLGVILFVVWEFNNDLEAPAFFFTRQLVL